MFIFINQRGGALLELSILIFILSTIAGGGLRIHASLQNRFKLILQERNEGIQKARQQTSNLLPARSEPFSSHLMRPFVDESRNNHLLH